jgi:acyl carrier protein
MKETKSRVLTLVRKITENSTISENSLLLDEGWIDSLTAVILLDELEVEFSIKMDTDELTHENFNTIENISKLILKQVER